MCWSLTKVYICDSFLFSCYFIPGVQMESLGIKNRAGSEEGLGWNLDKL